MVIWNKTFYGTEEYAVWVVISNNFERVQYAVAPPYSEEPWKDVLGYFPTFEQAKECAVEVSK